MNLREKILQANDIESKVITVKKWGVKLLLMELTGEQRNKLYENSRRDGVFVQEDFIYNLFIASVFDPKTRQPIFTNADIEALRKKNGTVFEEISKELMALSGLSAESQEEIEKN